MRRLSLALLMIGLATACTPPPATGPGAGAGAFPFDWPFRGHEPTPTGRQGMVVSIDERATEVGLEILQSGGNAVDAAIAVGFALAVVHPQAGNLGGGGFMVVRRADGETATLDYREEAPLALTPERYLNTEGEPTDESVIGHLASGVPGAVAGLAEAHRRYGSVPWETLVEPAIDLAENGFSITQELHEDLSRKAEILQRFEGTRRIFYSGDEPPGIGSPLRQPELAQTLRLIAQEGRSAFYRGRIADMIVREMRLGDGLITHEDLGRYQAHWRDPIQVEFRGHTVISMPPPSSGGVTMGQTLKILEAYDLDGMGWNTPEAVHLTAEAFRRAFADRNYYLGDPDFVDMPIDRLLSEEYAADLRANISRSRASASESFNRVPVISESRNTTHYSVVDAEGNAVAVTTTLNSTFGSGVVVRDAGFFLNNEMDDFTVRPGYPNQFGLIQGQANLVGAGRRPLSAMTPTIVVDSAGDLRMVLGSPGGPRIITAVTQVVLNVLEYGMSYRAAVNAPRIHHQLLPDEIRVESRGMDAITLSALMSMGHSVSPNTGYFGSVQLVGREPDGTLVGVADPRREGARALGY